MCLFVYFSSIICFSTTVLIFFGGGHEELLYLNQFTCYFITHHYQFDLWFFQHSTRLLTQETKIFLVVH